LLFVAFFRALEFHET